MQGDWGPDDKCKVTGRQVKTLKLPHNFTTASNGLPANHMGNNGLGMGIKREGEMRLGGLRRY